MSEPIVYVSYFRIKEGKLDELRQMSGHFMDLMEASKPKTVLHYGYYNEDGTEVSWVHVFPDADAMVAHVEGARERSQRAYEYIEPLRFEIFGRPSASVLNMMQAEAAEHGVPLVVKPQGLGGYIRLAGSQ